MLGELVIVFVGVYAAFALSEYQRERELDVRRNQLRLALIEEIEDITYNTRSVSFQAAQMREQYDSLHAAGEMPPLQPFLEPLRVETHMWEAVLTSGALDLLDVPTMYRMSRFYNQLNAGFEQFTQLRQLSQSMILPEAERGSQAFYDPDTGRLRPQYVWYLQGIGRIQEATRSVTELGERLVRELEQHTSPGARATYAAQEAEARQQADAFLELLDQGDTHRSWAELAPALQNSFPLERWEQAIQPRAAWGAIEGRELKHLRLHRHARGRGLCGSAVRDPSCHRAHEAGDPQPGAGAGRRLESAPLQLELTIV